MKPIHSVAGLITIVSGFVAVFAAKGLAMFMATASLFLGQPRVFPAPLRHAPGVRAIPILVVIGVILYWFVRVRSRRQRAARPAQGAA